MEYISRKRTTKGFVTVCEATVRRASGTIVERQYLENSGAAAVLAVDDDSLYMVRQPREAVGEDSYFELPAGTIDGEDSPLDTAARELAEECGLRASEWHELAVIHPSPGTSNETVWIYLAERLSEIPNPPAGDADEEIEVVRWPLSQLDELFEKCSDAKTLVALGAYQRLKVKSSPA